MNPEGKCTLRKYFTVGLSRTLLICSLLLFLTSSLGCSSKLWRTMTFQGDPTVEVQGSAVNIRAAATTSSSILTTAKRGEKLQVLDETGSWYQIKTKSGTTGWVHASLVK